MTSLSSAMGKKFAGSAIELQEQQILNKPLYMQKISCRTQMGFGIIRIIKRNGWRIIDAIRLFRT
jgi:hypothetical protein